MPYSDLPEPKFRVGQTVWYANTDNREAKRDCPDCLGERSWRVTTPGGGDYDVPCQRCASGYMTRRHDEVLPLAYRVAVAAPRCFTIKSVEVRSYSEGPSIYYDGRGEGGLFATEEEAQKASDDMAAAWNAKQAAEPEMLAAHNIGLLKIGDALYDQFANGLWNAWYAYHDITGKLDKYLGEDRETLGKEEVSYLKQDIRWTMEYRAEKDRPLDTLVDAVAAALAGDPAKLQAAYEALPEALKRRQAEGTEAPQVSATRNPGGAP